MNKAGISVIVIVILFFVGLLTFIEAKPHFGARHRSSPFHNNPCGPRQVNTTESFIERGRNVTCTCLETEDEFWGFELKLYRWNCTSTTIPTTTTVAPSTTSEVPSTSVPTTTDSSTTEAQSTSTPTTTDSTTTEAPSTSESP